MCTHPHDGTLQAGAQPPGISLAMARASPVARALQKALEKAGVEFINGQRPGVRLR